MHYIIAPNLRFFSELERASYASRSVDCLYEHLDLRQYAIYYSKNIRFIFREVSTV